MQSEIQEQNITQEFLPLSQTCGCSAGVQSAQPSPTLLRSSRPAWSTKEAAGTPSAAAAAAAQGMLDPSAEAPDNKMVKQESEV